MAYEQKVFNIGTLLTAADLSALQFTCVKVDASGLVAANTTSGGKILGILQNKPNISTVADVAVIGISKAKLGATVAAGASVMSDAAGKVITAATVGSTIIGIALEAGVVNEIVPVALVAVPGVV